CSYTYYFFLCLMDRLPPTSTLFPTRRSSDLQIIKKFCKFTHKICKQQSSILNHRLYLCNFKFKRMILPIIGYGDAVLRKKGVEIDRKSTRLNSSHVKISYAVFCLKKKKKTRE